MEEVTEDTEVMEEFILFTDVKVDADQELTLITEFKSTAELEDVIENKDL